VYQKSFNVREANKSDASALAVLAGELGYSTTREEMCHRLEYLISDTNHKIFVAEADSVAGWIQVSIRQSLESGSFAEIQGLVVAEAQRNRGIGKQLVMMAEAWAQQKGCEKIRVRTNVAREQAPGFYKHLGYESKKVQAVFDKSLVVGGLTNRSN
jgi:ribosomal protein S18 acetylase RimI-like enzyme